MALTSKKSDNNASYEQLEQQLAELRDQMKQMGKSVTALAREETDNISERAQTVKKLAVATAAEKAEELGEHYKTASANLEKSVRDQPLQALGIAAGIGFVLAMMMRSK